MLNKISSKIKDNFYIDLVQLIYIIFFATSLAFKSIRFQFITKLNPQPLLSELNKHMMLSSIGVIILIVALISIIFYKSRPTALFVTNIIITFLIIADTIYFRYFYSALTVSLVYQIGLLGSISDSIKNLIKVSDLIFIADLPIMLVALIYTNKRQSREQKPIKVPMRIVASILMATIGIFTVTTVFAKSDSDIYNYDNNHVIKQMGLLYYHYYDVKEFVTDNYLTDRTLSLDEKNQIEEYYENKPESGQSYKGVASKKNLVIVQVEALQEFVINKLTDEGNELTPNLNKLLGESTYFDNFYFQIGGGNTSDAEFLANNSLYPLKDGSIYFRYPGNTLYSLPKALKQKGYNTYAFHANNSTFWNRSAMYQSTGFDTFMSNRDYVLDEYVGWGLGDASFYRQSLDRIDKTQPFYGFFVTLSSHYPYNFEYFKTYDFPVGKYENTLLGDYFKAIHYADMALGKFIDQLKEQGIYDDTLLVIYGDHSAITKKDSADLMAFIGEEDNELEWAKIQKVPLIIRCAGVEEGEVKKIPSGEIDIFPTIANLMNLEAPFAMGKDLFNTSVNEGYALLRDGSVITDKYYYLNGIGEAFEIDTGRKMELEKYKEDLEIMRYELLISDIINQKDALKTIGK